METDCHVSVVSSHVLGDKLANVSIVRLSFIVCLLLLFVCFLFFCFFRFSCCVLCIVKVGMDVGGG